MVIINYGVLFTKEEVIGKALCYTPGNVTFYKTDKQENRRTRAKRSDRSEQNGKKVFQDHITVVPSGHIVIGRWGNKHLLCPLRY